MLCLPVNKPDIHNLAEGPNNRNSQQTCVQYDRGAADQLNLLSMIPNSFQELVNVAFISILQFMLINYI